MIYYKQRKGSFLELTIKNSRLIDLFWRCPFDSTSLSAVILAFLPTLKYELLEGFWVSVILVAFVVPGVLECI